MAKNKRNEFIIKESHLEDTTVALVEIRNSMSDWFAEVLNLAKKIELNATNSHDIMEEHYNSITRGNNSV